MVAGINAGICPLYIKDISPVEMAGTTGSFIGFIQKFGLRNL